MADHILHQRDQLLPGADVLMAAFGAVHAFAAVNAAACSLMRMLVRVGMLMAVHGAVGVGMLVAVSVFMFVGMGVLMYVHRAVGMGVFVGVRTVLIMFQMHNY